MAIKRISFLGLPLDVDAETSDLWNLMNTGRSARLATLLGPEAWSAAKYNPTFQNTLNQFSLVVPSSIIVSSVIRCMTGEPAKSMSFETRRLVHNFFVKMVESKAALAIVGGKPRDDEDSVGLLKGRFKGLNLVATAHGYGEFAPKISAILAKKPKVILVSMKTPLQEEFLVALKEAGYKGFALGCGDFIENFVITKDYFDHPTWADQFNLTPIYKICKSPRRALKYYVAQYKDFLSLVFQDISARVIRAGRSLRRRVTEAV